MVALEAVKFWSVVEPLTKKLPWTKVILPVVPSIVKADMVEVAKLVGEEVAK